MGNYLEARVSLFATVLEQEPSAAPRVGDVLSDIRSGTYLSQTAPLLFILRQEGVAAYTRAKSALPAFTPAAQLRTRSKDVPLADAVLAYTGVVYFDIDHLDTQALLHLRTELTRWPCLVFYFLSPSQQGLKVGLAADGIHDAVTYAQAWKQGADRFAAIGVAVDSAPKSPKSLCFVSTDGLAHVNDAITPFRVDPPPPRAPRPARPCSGNADESRVRSALEAIPNADCDYEMYVKIGMALHSENQGWQGLWDDWASTWPTYNQRDQDAKWKSFDGGKGVGLGTLFEMANRYGWHDPLRRERHDVPPGDTPHMYGTAGDPPPAQDDTLWHHNLLRKKGKKGDPPGAPLALLANIIAILHHDARWKGVLGFDEFSEMVTLTAPPPYLPATQQGPWEPRPLRDTDDSEACAWIQQQYLCHASTAIVAEALEVVARKHPYHAVRDYLASLTWDGTPRLDAWLYTYAHAEDTPFVRAVASKTLISAVARVMDPGCQVDTVLVMEGEQGERKSAFIRALANNRAWFSDDLPDLRDKDARQSLRGIWILELGELETLSKSEVETIKRFISAPSDFYRPSYGRRAMQFPRQTIFIGSTNRETYLKDDTGNRRFWPVRINTCNTEALEANRDQLWAEAFARHQRDEPWWLDQSMEQVAQSEQAKRVEFDEWVLPVMEYAKTQSSVLARDIFTRALSLEEQHHTPTNARRIGAILRLHGWKPKVFRESGILVKRFVRPEGDSPEPATASCAKNADAPW